MTVKLLFRLFTRRGVIIVGHDTRTSYTHTITQQCNTTCDDFVYEANDSQSGAKQTLLQSVYVIAVMLFFYEILFARIRYADLCMINIGRMEFIRCQTIKQLRNSEECVSISFSVVNK